MTTPITNDFVPSEISNTMRDESINYLEIKIPYSRNIRMPYYGYFITLKIFIDKVKNDSLIKFNVLSARTFGKEHPDYELIKGNMPVIIPSVIYRDLNEDEKGKGIKKRKENVSQLNGLWCVDIDVKEAKYDKYGKIEKESENINIDLKTILENDPYTLVSFKSFGGKGYAVLIYCEGINLSNSLEFYYSIEKYFKDTYNIIIDPARKNVNGLRYLTHDEDLFYNPNPKHFTWDDIKRDFTRKGTSQIKSEDSIHSSNYSVEVPESAEDWQNAINTVINYEVPPWETYAECLKIATIVPPFYFKQLCDRFHYKSSWNLHGENTTVFKGEDLKRFKNLVKHKGIRFIRDEKVKEVKKIIDLKNNDEIVKEFKLYDPISQKGFSNLHLLNQQISTFDYSNEGIQLLDDQFLGHYADFLIEVAKERKIHLWQVPAGGGKTELIKQLAKKYRVLVAIPTIAIIRNKFENDITYKDDFKFCYDENRIEAQLRSKKLNGKGYSIVSTIDQLSYMKDIESFASYFDFIIIDESHELTLSSYRLKCTGKLISNLLNYAKYLQSPTYKIDHEVTPPASLILMTGTPCGEQQLLGKENVRVTKFLPKKEKFINIIACDNRKHTFNVFVKKLLEILQDKKSLVFIPCNLGEIFINALMEFVGCEDFMIYSKNQSKSKNAKYVDENSLIPDHIKVVFGTRSAGCGLDFNNTDKKVSVLFPEMEISACIEQYISRFRKVDVDAYLFVQTINEKGQEFDFGFDYDFTKPYEYEIDEFDFENKNLAYSNSKNAEVFGKSGAEMETLNDNFVFDNGIIKQNKIENQRLIYSKMYYKIKHYEIGLKRHERMLYQLCGGLMRLNYKINLFKANLLTDNEEVSEDFRKLIGGVKFGLNLRLKEYFETLLPFAGISFKDWKYEPSEELKIDVESKTVTCPNFDAIKLVKKYLFKFFEIKESEEFIRKEMLFFDKFSEEILVKSNCDLEKRINFYKICTENKDVVVSLLDSIYEFWYNKSYNEIEVMEWRRNMTSRFLMNYFFDLDEKTQKYELKRFDDILGVLGNLKKKDNEIYFVPISKYDQLKSDVDILVSSFFKVETGKDDVFRKLEEFKVVKKSRISFDHIDEETLTEIKTKIKKNEGLYFSELRKLTVLDNGKEIDAFLKQFFIRVNRRRKRNNGIFETNYYLVEV